MLKYNTITDKAWSKPKFVARPLTRPWHGKYHGLLAIDNSRLIVGAGTTLHSFTFARVAEGGTPPINFEFSHQLPRSNEERAKRYVTAMSFINGGRDDCTIMLLGLYTGEFECFSLASRDKQQDLKLLDTNDIPTKLGQIHGQGGAIESIVAESNLVLALSADGTVTLARIGDNSPPSTLSLAKKSWSSYLNLTGSSPYAAIGTSSSTPLTIYSIREAGLSPDPTAILTPRTTDTSTAGSNQAVYAFSHGPLCFPWGASPEILVSGWYDGYVRVHDIRSSKTPVLQMADPWRYDSIYSVSCGGGSSSHVAAGCAQHSLVSFWDVRAPKTKGWSVHAPGNDRSPVYNVILESSRLFGVTQSRPFVYDFVSIGFVSYAISYRSNRFSHRVPMAIWIHTPVYRNRLQMV
jgi:hypothetical protein